MSKLIDKWLVIITLVAGIVMIPATANADVEVVATLGDLGAAAQEVVGDKGRVTVLAAAQQDPHFVDAKPSFVAELSKADLLVFNGMSLEVGWLPTLMTGSRNATIQKGAEGYFDASQYVVRRGVPDVKVERSMGDVHPEGNPHYTYDPRQMARVSLALGKRLAKIDPSNADYYQRRAKKFAKECIRLAQKWELKFDDLSQAQRKVVVYHEAWSYVTNWLDLEMVIPVEPKPGVPPNPQHVASVLDKIEATGAAALLQMEYYPSSTAEVIADKSGIEVLRLQGQTREGQSYLDRVDTLASKIYEAIGGSSS